MILLNTGGKMKRIRRIALILTCLLFAAFLSACDIAVESIQFEQTSVVMQVGTTKDLSVQIAPLDATNQNIVYSSSNNLVASVVENKTLLAKAVGNARIVATVGNLSAFFDLVVVQEQTPLQVPNGLRFDEWSGRIVWNAVEHASKYEVKLNNEIYETNNPYFDREIVLNAVNTVQVRAIAVDPQFVSSNYSPKLEFLKLGAPQDLRYDTNTQILTWAQVAGLSYRVSVNGVLDQAQTTASYQTRFHSAGTYQLSVVALKGNVFSALSETLVVQKLASVSSLRIESNKLLWNAVLNAKTYELTITSEDAEDTVMEVSSNVLDFATVELPSGQHNVTIVAKSDAGLMISSNASEMFTFDSLPKVSGLTQFKNQISWSAVMSEVGSGEVWYSVVVYKGGMLMSNMGIQTLQTTNYTIPNGQSAGNYVVKIYAYKNGTVSTEFAEISYVIQQIAQPVIESFDIATKTFVVIGQSAAELVIRINGVAQSGQVTATANGYQFVLDSVASLQEVKIHEITAQLQDSTTANLVHSNPSAIYNIERLAAPVLSISDNVLSFSRTLRAELFDLYLSNDDGASWNKVQSSQNVTYTFETEQAGTYQSKVVAVGNGNTTLSSAESVVLTNIVKFAAPTVQFNKLNKKLMFENLTAERDVLLVITLPAGNVVETNIGQVSDYTFAYTAAGKYTISARTLNQEDNEVKSDLSSEIEVTVLSQISHFAYKNEEGISYISFQTVTHATSYQISVGGVIMNPTLVSEENGLLTYNIGVTDELFAAVKSHSIQVRSVSEQSNTLSSLATNYLVKRLASPGTISGPTSQNAFSWDSVNGALSGYDVYFDAQDAVHVSLPIVTIENIALGQHTITIFSVGDNVTTLSSLTGSQYVFEKRDGLLSVSNLAYTNVNQANQLTFVADARATELLVFVNDVLQQGVATTSNGVTTFVFETGADALFAQAKTHTISVVTKSGNQYIDDSLATEIQVVRHGAMQSFEFLNSAVSYRGTVSWTNVVGNNGYAIYLDGAFLVKANKDSISQVINGLSFGVNFITIYVLGNETQYLSALEGSSMYVQHTYKLETPQATFLKNTMTLVVTPVVGATDYVLTINNGEELALVQNGANYVYQFTTEFDVSGTYELNVKATNPGSLDVTESDANVITIQRLPTVTGIKKEANYVVWNMVSGLNVTYLVQFDSNTPSVVTNPQISVSGFSKGLYSVSVKAISSHANTLDGLAYANPVQFEVTQKIAATSNLIFIKKSELNPNYTLSFDAVADAASYQILVNGSVMFYHTHTESSRQTFVFAPEMIEGLAAGRYTFTIITVPKTGLHYENSLASLGKVVEKLDRPTNPIISGTESISFSTLSTDISSGYKILSIADANGQGQSLSSLSEYVGTITIRVQHLGKSDVFLDSDVATYTILRLATPAKPTIQNNNIQWGNSSNAIGTKLIIKQNNVVVLESTFDNSITSYSYAWIAGLDYEVVVQHIVAGAQSTYLSSRTSEVLTVKKLISPSNVTFAAAGENQNEGLTITWEHDGLGVSNFSIFINNELHGETNGVAFAYDYTDVQTGSVYQIGVRANGINANGFLSSEISNVSNTQRLATPTGLAITTSAYLTWNGVLGATGYKLEVFSSKTQAVIPASRVTVDATQFAYDYGSLLLEGDYAGVLLISVMAVGNGSTKLSSDNAVLTVTKLADTQIEVSDFALSVAAVGDYKLKLFLNNTSELALNSSNSYSIPDNSQWGAGEYSFSAYAVPSTATTNVIRSRTATKTVTRLETPNITDAGLGFMRDISDADMTLVKWKQVNAAFKYQVKINNLEWASSPSSSLVLGNNIPNGNLTFEVIAYGTAGTHFASRKLTFQAFKLTENFNTRNINGVFGWDFTETNRASALKIAVAKENQISYINLTNFDANTNPLEGFFGQLSIKMKAVGNVDSTSSGFVVLDSNYSANADFHKLATPVQLKAIQGELQIENREMTNDYPLIISRASNRSEFRVFDLFTYYLTPSFESFVMPNVEYKAHVKAQKSGFLSSDNSNEISIQLFDFNGISANFKIERVDDENSKLVWNAPLDAQNNPVAVGGYKIRVTYESYQDDNVFELDADLNEFLLSLPTIDLLPGYVYFQLAAVGSSETDENNTYWLSSKYFGNALGNKLAAYKLLAPTPSVNFGKVEWEGVTNALSHRLLLMQDLNATTVYAGNDLTSFDIASLGIYASEIEDKNYLLNMMAIGDGVNTLSSTLQRNNNMEVVLPKTPGEIVLVNGGLRFKTLATENYYEDFISMEFPSTETYPDFNPYYGFIEIKLINSNGQEFVSYVWPELLSNPVGASFAIKYESDFTVAKWHDGISRITHVYENNFKPEALSKVSYIGIQDLFPNLIRGTYTMTYRQVGDSTSLLSSKYSTKEVSVTVMDSVKNVRIIESAVDSKPYLTWTAASPLVNAGTYTPTYQIVAYNSTKDWWDYLYETTETSILIDNTTLFGGVDGVTFLYPYHTRIAVVLKGNSSQQGATNYISSIRTPAQTLNVSVLGETEQFGVQNGLLQWSVASNPVKYSVKYMSSGITNEYFAMNGASWNMANLAPGSYALTVQAIGNAYSTNNAAIVNGKPSQTKNFYKLPAPSVTVSWGYFVFNQIEVASGANNAQFISSKYLVQGSTQANSNFKYLTEGSEVKTLRPANTAFGTSDNWKIEYTSPAGNDTYFKFQAFGSTSANESGQGFVTSDATTIPSNTAKYRLTGFNATEKIEVMEGKLVWPRKATAPHSNYYWLQFTKLNSDTEVVVHELVQLPSVYSGDSSKVEYVLTNSIGPGSWSVVVKNTNATVNLNSLPSLSTNFIKLHDISGEEISGGYVSWDPVVWDLDDITGANIVVEFENPFDITKKQTIKVKPDATILNESTVIEEHINLLNSLTPTEWKVRIKTSKTSQPTDTVKVVDSVWKQIGTTTTKLDVVTNIEKVDSLITWTPPNQTETYHYRLRVQRKNEETKAVSYIETVVEQASYTPDGGYSIMSLQVQTIPVSGTALASSWSDIAVFTKLSAPPTAAWNANLKGFELRIPQGETVPQNYSYSIQVQFMKSGEYAYTTKAPIIQPASQPVYYPMEAGTYRIAYAIVVGGVVGDYQTNPSTGEITYSAEQVYNDFAYGDGSVAKPFEVSRSTVISNIKFRSWANFIQTGGESGTPVTVTAPIEGQRLVVERTGNILTFTASPHYFTGKYNGNGKFVQLTFASNTTDKANIGMFERVGTGAVITNLNIRTASTLNLESNGQIYVGLIAGQVSNHLMIVGSQPVISKITVLSGTLSVNYTNPAGGTSATIYMGAIAGYIDGATISESTNHLSIQMGTGNARSYFAGIVGLASSNNAFGTEAINLLHRTINNGAITASVSGGLICNASQVKITESANKGNITSSVSGTNFESTVYAAVAGGLVALATRIEVEYSYNRGNISILNSADLSRTYNLTAFVGGLIARAESSVSLKFSYNSGRLESDTVNTNITKRAGFLVAFVASATPVLERVFYAVLTLPNNVTPNIIGVSKTQTEMQASNFIGTTLQTLPSSHFTAVSGNYPKLSFE